MSLRPEEKRSKKQQKQHGIWLEIRLQKKFQGLLQITFTKAQKYLHKYKKQRVYQRKNTYHQKGDGKLLINFKYYNQILREFQILRENEIPEDHNFSGQH